MTVVNANLKDSYGSPLVGYIQVTLDYLVNNQVSNTTYLPVSYKVPLVNGVAAMNLQPSELAQVTYHFEVYQSITDSTVTPAVTNSYLIWDFRAKVPDSTTAIAFSDLAQNTGVAHDQLDASFTAITRYLLNSSDFWVRFQQEVFRPKGTYNTTAFYRYGDVVTLDGSSYFYISTTTTQGNQPPNTTFWQPLANRGNTGTGTAGNDTAYDATAWLGQLDAPSRNTVRNLIETLATKTDVAAKVSSSGAALTSPTLVSRPTTSDNSTLIPDTGWIQANLDIIRKALVPVGTIVSFGGTSAPSGWLLCDGSKVLRTSYPNLFSAIGTTYNTSGELTTEFRLPDLRGRVAVGRDNMGSATGAGGRILGSWASVMGGNFGEEKHTLTLSEIPSHNHTSPTASTTILISSNTTTAQSLGGSGGTAVDYAAATANAGGGAAHNVIQPSYAIQYIVYAG